MIESQFVTVYSSESVNMWLLSRLAPCVMDTARRVADASPDEVKRTFRQSYRELNRVLPEKIKDRLPNLAPSQI